MRTTLSDWLGSTATVLALAVGGASAQSAGTPTPGALSSATVPTRVALVIANAAYANPADAIAGARRDGQTMRVALEAVGFRVTLVQDASKPQMEASVRAFQRSLRDAGPTGIGFLYYAGHGGADHRRQDNYLLPVDIDSVTNADFDSRGVGVRWITDLLRNLDERPAIAVVVDACRSVAATPSRGGNQAASAKLDMIEPDELADRGYMVAFSTSKGQPASDSGQFAEALASRLTTRGLTLDQVFEQARQEVANKTRQVPTSRSSLIARVCLAGCDEAPRTDALTTLKTAVAERALGDVGQIAAIQQLARAGRSLAGFDLKGLHLKGGALENVDFSAAEMEGANLEESRLAGSVLAKAQMSLASMKRAQAQGAILRETRLHLVDGGGADFSEIDGVQSHWRGASLRGASFRRARLQSASFMMADLRDVDFRGADLRGTFFIGALLTGAKFDDAELANTDVTGAVGQASQFNAKQQAALCATENQGGFRLKLMRVTKSTRFASGEDYSDLFSEYVDLGPGLKNLDRCERRAMLPAGASTIYLSGDKERTSSEMTLRFPAELLDRGGRQRQYVERARSVVELLNEARKVGPFIRVQGEEYRRLLAALQRNVDNAKLESSPAVLDGDAFVMYMLRYRPSAMLEENWASMAHHWAEREFDVASMRRSYGNVWPLFFPPRTSGSELAAEHVDMFRRWTFNRARAFPTRVIIEESQVHELRHAVLNQRGRTGSADMTLQPLRALIASRGPAAFPPSLAGRQDRDATYLHAQQGGWSRGDAVIRLPRTVDKYEVRLGQDVVEIVDRDNVGLRLTLDVRGYDVISSGNESLTVLNAEVAEMVIIDSAGRVIR